MWRKEGWLKQGSQSNERKILMPFSKYSAKQKKLARVAAPRNKITGADLRKLRKKKK